MTCINSRYPSNDTYQDTLKFLVWNQYPVIMDKSIKYFASLPSVGVYKHFNSTIVPFMNALHEVNSRQFTMSGVGSLIDKDRYGNKLHRPTPQLQGTGCNGTSLCVDTTCFSFTEGVMENNNLLETFCWSLSLSCLKDYLYSDKDFERKMKQHFAMFFAQPPAVAEAYQRTTLLQEAVKIVCTDRNIRYTGNLIGGSNGISLPFYVNPADPTAFPNVNSLPNGTGVGGANLSAFVDFLAPRLFSGSFSGNMEDVMVYGLKEDFNAAKAQTASVQDKYIEMEMLRMLSYGSMNMDQGIFGNFATDGMFPTFDSDTNGNVYPITQEILEASTIAGYFQTTNPEHSLAPYRGILFVPSNWRFNIVEPPVDNFSYLGLGDGLNFGMNTPGVFPLMTSSMFSRYTIGEDGTVVLGQRADASGMVSTTARGLVARERAIREAIRTELLMTYTSTSCNDATDGQIPQAARPIISQSAADGFMLKSKAYFGTDVQGTARPVLLLFKTDTPRSARPIEVCTVEEVEIDQTGGVSIVDCCPGGQAYAILTFSSDVSDLYTAEDVVLYRTGARGDSYLATVTAVSGAVVSITASGEGVTLPCCSGSPDDYGTRAELISLENITALSGTIMKAGCSEGNLLIELFTPVTPAIQGATGTITLCNGSEIAVALAEASTDGIFFELTEGQGETCDLCDDLTCECFINAVFELDVLN